MRTGNSDRITILALMALIITNVTIRSQTGGTFEITQSVVAGGASGYAGGDFTIEGTAGQHSTARSNAGSGFVVAGGFWAASLAPTAAGVSISGQIRTANGYGIRNARITLTQLATGETTSVLSSTFGYYRFEGVIAGRLYLLTADAKQFTFDSNMRVISLVDELTNEDFIAAQK